MFDKDEYWDKEFEDFDSEDWEDFFGGPQEMIEHDIEDQVKKEQEDEDEFY